MQRLAFSGWWTSTNIEQANSIEARKNDNLRFSAFSTIVNGSNGQSIPHLQAYEELEGLWPDLLK